MDVPVRFDDLPWESPSPGVRYKAFASGSQRVRLLEFREGFEKEHARLLLFEVV